MPLVGERIEFPNPAIWAINYLTPLLPAQGFSAAVRGEVPSSRPSSLVVVENAGGNQYTVITDATQLLVGCWDTTNPAAERLSARVRALLRQAPGMKVGGILCVKYEELGRPVYLPDPDANVPRYRQNIILHLRGYTV